ncbi:hypothetical protein VKT23_019590 [Stygiomarasmius scandens]|uniref:Uncharacterized protein n=1 Tax=Marasmiellus scandens TaxID=2682957 RepID=A0ABR1IPA1_9AGAR
MTKPPKAKSILQARKAISTKEKRQPPKPKHAGRGYFQGGPLELLEESFVDYMKISGNRENFWDELKGKWLKKYPSNLTKEERARVLELKKRLHLDGLADDNEDGNLEKMLMEKPRKGRRTHRTMKAAMKNPSALQMR